MSRLAHSNLTTMNIIEVNACLEDESFEFISDEEQKMFDRLLSCELSVEEAITEILSNKNSVVKGFLLCMLRNSRLTKTAN